jgi:hypothetical protein
MAEKIWLMVGVRKMLRAYAAERRNTMQAWLRVLIPGTLAMIFMGLAAQPVHSQYWRRPYNPAYGFFWQNYWYNYAPANYFPGGYWYNRITNYSTPYSGYYWRYPYGYSPVFVYEVPYYVPVPDPYPVIPPSNPASSKASTKETATKQATAKSIPPPPEPQPPMTTEEIKKQEERDAARQLKLARNCLKRLKKTSGPARRIVSATCGILPVTILPKSPKDTPQLRPERKPGNCWEKLGPLISAGNLSA